MTPAIQAKITRLRTEIAFLRDDERGGVSHEAERRELVGQIERLERGEIPSGEIEGGTVMHEHCCDRCARTWCCAEPSPCRPQCPGCTWRGAGWALCALLALASGCARITTMAGNSDGVACTEWRAHHPLSSPTIWVLCRDEHGDAVDAYPFQSSNPLAPLLSAVGAML